MDPILLVEDDKLHAELIFRSFESQGNRFSLTLAQNLSQAASAIRKERPYLIISDYRLPDGIGTDLITREKNGPLNPVVIMTGFGDEQLAVEALKSGALDYIVKSEHTLSDLPHIASRALREWKLRQDREQAQEALLKSEKKYRVLFDGAPLMYVITRSEEGIVVIDDVNELFLTTLGYQYKEVVDQPLFKFYGSTGAGLACISEYQASFKRSTMTSECSLLAKNGTAIDTLFTTVPDMDENGQILGSRVMYIDISALKKVEREKQVLESQLRQAQKMEAIGTLAGGIAHDFNNILSAVIGYSELTLAETSVDATVHQNLQKILQAGFRAKDLVRRILHFSRQNEVMPIPVKADQITKEALKLLHATLPTTVEIRQSLDKGLYIMADPTQIHQVIMNLCTNALHAMNYDGKLSIALKKIDLDAPFTAQYPDLSPGHYLKLSVKDTGCGIAPDTMERIFDPFFTTKGKDSGTGMGLSVVHGIIKSHGGGIIVESAVNVGTTFNIYLPSVTKEPHSIDKPETPLQMGTERILFVDDKETQVRLGERMLSYLGYKVTGCTGSKDALKMFCERPNNFDLVITDMTMPHMTGDELADKLLKIRPDLPIIICTGYSEKLNKEKLNSMGIAGFSMKPVIMKNLARLIRQALSLKKTRGANLMT